MARYIDAEKLLTDMHNSHTRPIFYKTDEDFMFDRMVGLVVDQPIADVVEMKHGEWEVTEAYPHWVCCSVCHKKFVPNDEWIDRYNISNNFCPNCGAKMDGGTP